MYPLQTWSLPDPMFSTNFNMVLSDLKLSIVNFCSVVNKQVQLETFIANNDIDIIIGTESHLNETILNSEIFPNNFQTYGKDRNSYGGGVFVLVKSSIPSSQIDINSSIEIVWSYIHLNKNSDVIVGSVYCPPHSADTVLEDLQSYVVEIKRRYPSAQIILGGDFNCPGIDWEHGTLTDSYVPQLYLEKLITLIQDTQMSQLVIFPTRGINILDLCLCTHPDSVLSCEPISGFSDHDAIILSIQTTRQVIKQHPRTVYLYRSADWDKIREELAELLHVYFELNNNSSSQTLKKNWSFFQQGLQRIIEEHTPTKVLSTKSHLPWMSTALIRKKQRVHNRARRFHRENDWSEYKLLQKEVDEKLKHQHKSYISNLISASNNKKSLWYYLKTKRQGYCGISTLKNPQDGHTVTDPLEKANILNQHFKSVFTTDDNITIPDKGPSLFPSLPQFQITEQRVYNILSNCDASKSPGPDSIHSFTLKATAAEFLLC